jgi:hypothetical protein
MKESLKGEGEEMDGSRGRRGAWMGRVALVMRELLSWMWLDGRLIMTTDFSLGKKMLHTKIFQRYISFIL